MPGKKDGNKRTLVRWSDDLDKQLLLSIQYACNEAGLRIPWDNVARLMGEKFSDGAIVQHMSKLRQKMVENDLPVPPPLKRGTTVVPSKIYATSSTARRKSMPETPNATSTVVTPKSKQSTSKKRGRRSGVDSDSDSQPDEDDMDMGDTSDDEYGASGRKKKKQQRQPKPKVAGRKKAIQESVESDDETVERTKGEEADGKNQDVEEKIVKESVETPGPASRTRGVRPDYSKLEQASDEEEVDDDDIKAEGVEGTKDEETASAEEEIEDAKIKSDGEVSPRSKVPVSAATPAHLTNLASMNGSQYSGTSAGSHALYYGTRAQYQSPQSTFPGVPSTNYLPPRSTMTSFSTNRNDSASSMTSSMPAAFSAQSSFSHAPMSQLHLSAHSDYYNAPEIDFQSMRHGFDSGVGHGGSVFPTDDDDHEDFNVLFGDPNRQI